MKRCRILSISITAISLIISAVIIGFIISNNSKTVYATSIKFKGEVRGVEIYVDNKLIINKDLIVVEPGDCNIQPEFTIKKYGGDEEIVIVDNSYDFKASGRYTLSCKAKSSKDHYVRDSITLNVVNAITDTTSMYIKQKANVTLYEEDEVDVSAIVKLECPTSSKVEYNYNKFITINKGTIKAMIPGLASLDVVVSYDNIVISKQITIIVKPKTIGSDISLKLTINNDNLQNNIININNDVFNFAINYELINSDNQLIICWTNDYVVDIVSFECPTIIIKPLKSGSTTIYVSPVGFETRVFEIVINVS